MAGRTGQAGWLAWASRPRWPVALQVGVLGALAGALGEEDRAVVAACQGPLGSERPHQGPRSIGPREEDAGALLQAPSRQRRAWQCCPAPPRLTPAQQQAEVATRQAADCPRPSVWTTQPPATLLLGLACFPLAGRSGCGCRRVPQQLCSSAGRLHAGRPFPQGQVLRGWLGPSCGNTTAWGSSATLGPLPAGRREGPACCRARSAVRQGCPAPCGDAE